jgi:hypothetical protein
MPTRAVRSATYCAGARRVSSLVRTVVCVRARLLDTSCPENGFVDNVAHVHGRSVSA